MMAKCETLLAKPVIGMAHYKMGELATLKLQIVKLTKRSVSMKTINGKGVITVSTTNGDPIESIIKIERLPCSIIPSITTKKYGTVEVPQGTEGGW